MNPADIQSILEEFATCHADRRVDIFDVKIGSLSGNHLDLEGKVLEARQLQELCDGIHERFAGLEIGVDGVQVLRCSPPRMVTVATNLTDLRAAPDWQSELLSQLFFGWKIEALEMQDRWARVRQLNGYLGWAYLPYLSNHPAAEPTHMVVNPISLVRTECGSTSLVVGRLFGGTPVQVVAVNGECAEVDAQVWGWVARSELRSYEEMPRSTEERRRLMVSDAARLMGVPYLWGGCSALGIDCSGFTHLVHRQAGVSIPRDADQQFAAGRPVEPPFEPGDLLFFGEPGSLRTITHVGLSLGGWKIIHSSRSRNGVYQDDVQNVAHLRETFAGAASFV